MRARTIRRLHAAGCACFTAELLRLEPTGRLIWHLRQHRRGEVRPAPGLASDTVRDRRTGEADGEETPA